MRSPNAVVDGEVARIDTTGRTSFSELQQGSGQLVYYAFDLLELDGEPLVDLPLHERKDRLTKLIDARVGPVAVSEGFDDGDALFEVARDRNLEGIVAKRVDSTYKSGPPHPRLAEAEDGEHRRVRRRRLHARRGPARGHLRRARARRARRAASCATSATSAPGSTTPRSAGLLTLLKPLHRDTSPFAEAPKMPRVRKGDVQWVEPRLVAQVRYGEWTHDGHLRHPAYLGCVTTRTRTRSTAPAAAEAPLESVIRKGKRELKLSNLDKPFWPDEGITKGDLLRYYRDVAPVLVPHLKDRPFTMRRYPHGAYSEAFFQKDAPKHMPEWISTFHANVSAARQRAHEAVDRLPARRTTSSRCSGW